MQGTIELMYKLSVFAKNKPRKRMLQKLPDRQNLCTALSQCQYVVFLIHFMFNH